MSAAAPSLVGAFYPRILLEGRFVGQSKMALHACFDFPFRRNVVEYDFQPHPNGSLPLLSPWWGVWRFVTVYGRREPLGHFSRVRRVRPLAISVRMSSSPVARRFNGNLASKGSWRRNFIARLGAVVLAGIISLAIGTDCSWFPSYESVRGEGRKRGWCVFRCSLVLWDSSNRC